MMDDWCWEDILDTHEIQHLDEIYEMEDLRVDSPIVWMVLTGHSDSRDIASKLGWPHELTLAMLRHYKKEGLVFDECGADRMLWRISTSSGRAEHLLALDRWRRGQSKRGGIFRPAENDENA
jgi:hypothetical protein